MNNQSNLVLRALWTEDQIATLTKLWAEGCSSGVIAGVLGVSRSAVMGKLHRLKLTGLGGHKLITNVMSKPTASVARAKERMSKITGHVLVMKPNRAPPKPKPEPKPVPKPAVARPAIAATKAPIVPRLPRAPAAVRMPLASEIWLALPGSLTVTMMDLGKDQCRWPIGAYPFEFCGVSVSEGHYCAVHAKVAYRQEYANERRLLKQLKRA